MLSRDDVDRLLRELAAELASRGVRGHLFLVGGAAMAAASGRDRVTRDVDAMFEPKQTVYEAARTVGRRHGLGDDWLNDGVKTLLTGADPDATTFLDEPVLVVQIASPRYLFTLKALASRVDRDAADLVTLYRLCGFDSVDEALDTSRRRPPPVCSDPRHSSCFANCSAERPCSRGRLHSQRATRGPGGPGPVPQPTLPGLLRSCTLRPTARACRGSGRPRVEHRQLPA